ncbi:hypothetical protein Pmani_012976 [Petrolisthes manimaculis]|uniref:Centromere protein S n=1 Tax=Petrolisthes manimaculis TaxID=1843537 RepID=A0AAE1PY52_9EUCA|nr:hypothetical protein Pmani_012976 [Petrolisthes manimaculis]
MADEEDHLNKRQTLKAAIHFTVGRVCEEIGAEQDLTFSRHVIATLSELTSRQLQTYATDLEAFAGHAKRTVIAPDDVKLLVRRNPQMSAHIKALIETTEEEKGAKKKKKKKTKDSEGKSMDVDIETID